MKKKIIYIILTTVTLWGCDDFLTKDVLGRATADDYYDTTYKLGKALNATFDILQSDTYNDCEWIFGEACGDDVIGDNEDLSSQRGQLVHFLFSTSNSWIKSRYEINYKGINRANQVIANAHRVKLASDDYSAYKSVREILGQAKVLRALFYFNLVKTYGGVPIRPEIEDINYLSAIPRSTKEEVYAYIEKDLREAAIMLDGRYVDGNAGMISCGAAIALLMKIKMYQAVPGELSEKWEDMVELGEYFIDGKAMTYREILRYDSSVEDWDTLRERLWFKPKEKLISSDSYETPETNMPVLSNLYSVTYRSKNGELINYYDIFFQKGEFCRGSVWEVVFKESADGTTGDNNEGSSVFNTLYDGACYVSSTFLTAVDGDPREKSIMVQHQDVLPDGDRCNIGTGKIAGIKWYTPIAERPQYSSDNGKNRRLIRYAEVILMYAEALNECSLGARALVQLNKTKTEANKISGSATLYVAASYGQMRKQIWKERRIELVHEWDRFFDLVRQQRAAEVLQEYGRSQVNKRGYYFIKGVNEVFPIPQNEIDLTNGIVTQNPGY